MKLFDDCSYIQTYRGSRHISKYKTQVSVIQDDQASGFNRTDYTSFPLDLMYV